MVCIWEECCDCLEIGVELIEGRIELLWIDCDIEFKMVDGGIVFVCSEPELEIASIGRGDNIGESECFC